jgi:mono/diheme cytochrome c family protein
MKPWLLGLIAVLVAIAGSAFAAIELRWKRTFDIAPPALTFVSDEAAIERGRYLIYGPAACAYCHVPRERWSTLDEGTELPLTGNHVFRLPPGEFFSANLTPDPATGIGRRTDAQIARMLRHGVRADNRAAFPLMSYQNLSDDDLVAIVAFLKSRPPVVSAVPDHRLTLLGKALMAFAIAPAGPATTPPRTSPAGPSVERGEYLANAVSACAECHTDRADNGQLVGPRFGGGQRMDLADPTKIAVPPNLTPDADTSPIGRWDEGMFVVRLRAGEVEPGTPMPWGAFAHMTEDDVRSIYRYLRTLPPTRHDTGPGMQKRQ